MKNNIIISNNFFSDIECDSLIELYERQKHMAKPPKHKPPKHNNVSAMPIYRYPNYENRHFTHFRKKLHKSVLNLTKQNDIEPDWGILYKWPEGSYHDPHYDTASEKTILTTVAYLNDNFTGGATYLGCGTKIAPQKGRLLIFNGNKILHGVEPIQEGERYSFSVWWKKSEKK